MGLLLGGGLGAADSSGFFRLLTCAGTFFHLLEDTAHPCLSISEDGFTIFYGDEELPISAMALDDNTFARSSARHTFLKAWFL